MTELSEAKKGNITAAMKEVALAEGVDPQKLCELIASGEVVISRNKNHKIKPLGIGKGLRVKVNANIGTSPELADIDVELAKLDAALEAKTDTIMDLSIGGDLTAVRKAIMERCTIPIGTVPLYEAAAKAKGNNKSFVELTPDDFFDVIEKHGEEGVDFITVHCGVNRESLARMHSEGRVLDIVSRGGALTAEWIRFNDQENPLFEQYDRLLDIAYKYDMTLSLGDGMRPGCVADATDRAQIIELLTLGELASRAFERNVQVMIEGPGHVPLHQIEANILLQKQLCHGAPFYVLGPLVTDIAPGYDHITAAIGGAIAALAGADFLCYVTPSEHLRLPTPEDVREGVIAARIAGHAADLSRGVKAAVEQDLQMAKFRKALDWEGQIKTSIDPKKARELRGSVTLKDDESVCSMCGTFCAIKISDSGKH